MAKQNFDIITIGGATRDIMFYTDHGRVIENSNDIICQKLLGFELAAKINIKNPYYNLGGGACNTAINFSELGLKVGMIVRVGGDEEGKKVIEELKKHKVNVDLAQVEKKAITGFSFLVIGGKDKEYVAFVYRGSNDNLRLAANDLKFKTKWIYLSSLSGKNWKDALNKIAFKIRQSPSNIQLAWNPGYLQLKAGYSNLSKFLKIVKVLILNKDEAIELVYPHTYFGQKLRASKNAKQSKVGVGVYSSGKKIGDINQLLKIIKSWGPEMVAITEGDKGAWVYDGINIYYQSSYPVKAIDTTGAGDAFGSTFVAGLILNNNLEKALKLAIVNSASVITKIGAHNGLLNLKDLEKKISKI